MRFKTDLFDEIFWQWPLPWCSADDDGGGDGGGDGGAGDDDGGGGDDGGAATAGAAAGGAGGGAAGGDDGGSTANNNDASSSADDGKSADTSGGPGGGGAQGGDAGAAASAAGGGPGGGGAQGDDGGINEAFDKGDIGAAAGQSPETGPAAGYDAQGFNTNAFPDSGIALGVGPLGDAVAAAPLAPLDTNNTTGLQTTPEPAGVTPDVSKTLSNANVGDVGIGGVSPAVAANAAGLAGGISSAQDILSGNSPVAAALDAANATQTAAAAGFNPVPGGGNQTTTVTEGNPGFLDPNDPNNFVPATKGDLANNNLPGSEIGASFMAGLAGQGQNGNLEDSRFAVAPDGAPGTTIAGNDPSAVGVFGLGNLGSSPSTTANQPGFNNNGQLDPSLLGQASLNDSVFGVQNAPQNDPTLATLPGPGGVTPNSTTSDNTLANTSPANAMLAGSTGMQSALGGQNVASVDVMANLGGQPADTTTVASFPGTTAASTSPMTAGSLGGQAATTDTSATPTAGPSAPSTGPGPATTADVASTLANAPASGNTSSPVAADGSSGVTPQTLINPIPQNTGVMTPINDPNGAAGPIEPTAPSAPLADDGAPSGYFNPDAGVFAAPARSGGFAPPPSASIPASDGTVGPSANSAALSSDGAPAGYYSPEAGIYDTLNNATDTGPP